MALSGSVAVAQGAVTATVSIAPSTLTGLYSPNPVPSWASTVQVTSITSTQFVVSFGTPAPANATLYWNVAVSGALLIAAGAVSAAVALVGPLTGSGYVPGGCVCSWNTTVQIVSAASSSFTVSFGTPCPPGGGTLYYSFSLQSGPSVQPQFASLQTYLDDLRRLLHDPNDTYWSAADKTVYINKGMQRRDVDSGGNRQLFTVPLVIGQDVYTFADTGNAQVYDVVAINLIYNNLRYVMGRCSFTELNAYIRQYRPSLQWAPVAFARYGPSQIVMGPAPSVTYDTEWDCLTYSIPLVNLTDTDPVPYPYTNAVPYYAAYWAKYNERKYDEAADFKRQYDQQILVATNARVGTVPSMYSRGMVVRV